jgi:glutaredoxin-like YruB-family protein
MEKRLSVIVFTTPTCSWCKKVKTYLKEKQIRYKEVDVSRDQRAMKDMVRKSGQMGVPQLWINNRPVVGFDKAKIERLINN